MKMREAVATLNFKKSFLSTRLRYKKEGTLRVSSPELSLFGLCVDYESVRQDMLFYIRTFTADYVAAPQNNQRRRRRTVCNQNYIIRREQCRLNFQDGHLRSKYASIHFMRRVCTVVQNPVFADKTNYTVVYTLRTIHEYVISDDFPHCLT